MSIEQDEGALLVNSRLLPIHVEEVHKILASEIMRLRGVDPAFDRCIASLGCRVDVPNFCCRLSFAVHVARHAGIDTILYDEGCI